MNIPDNYTLWEIHNAEQERRLERCPICANCGEHIQDGYYYFIDDGKVCRDCLESDYRREVDEDD